MQFSITVPIFALIGIGYLAVRLDLIPKALVRGLGQFVLFFGVPALIFRALSNAQLDTVLDRGFLIAYGVSCFAVFGLAFMVFKGGVRKTATESGLNAFGAAMPNSIFIGLPVLLQLFGEVPAGAFTMVLLVENFLIFPLALIVMDAGAAQKGTASIGATLRAITERLIKNPILLAIFAGVVVAMLDWRVPAPAAQIIDLIAQAAPATALFFIGGVLVGAKITGHLPTIAGVCGFKLLIHPALVIAILMILPPLSPDLRVAIIIFAACPMLTIYPIIAAKYGLEEEGASTLLAATALSFLSISALLAFVV